MQLTGLVLKIKNNRLLVLAILLVLTALIVFIRREATLKSAVVVLPPEPSTVELTPTAAIAFKGESAKIVFPAEVETYQILPAPYELFSPEASRTIAQNLGFTSQASAGVSGDLIYYSELGRTLELNRLAGTINFSLPFELLAVGQIDLVAANTAVYSFFKGFGLDPNLLGWQNAKVQAYGLKDGLPEQTATSLNLAFLEFRPNLTLGNRSLITLQPNFMRIGAGNRIIGFSFWLPNLDWENPKKVRIKSLERALEDLRLGNVLFREGKLRLDKIDLTKVELAYFLEPETLADFTKPRYLTPVFKFGSKDGTVYVEAEE